MSTETPPPRRRRPPPPLPPECRALLDPAQIALALGVSRRTFYAMLSTGQYPKADLHINRMPRWTVDTHNAWLVEKCEGKGC